jgi:hypothetical protein
MANVGASSRQNQSNIDETQRNVFKKVNLKRFSPQINLKRLIDKNNLYKGIKLNRRSLL